MNKQYTAVQNFENMDT